MSLLSLSSISKNYGGVRALSEINLDVKEGEIHSIVGENGAGKSTLMKIISGVTVPSHGTITFDGEKRVFKNVKDSEDIGVFLVHQEPMFFPDLTVLENIFIGNEIKNKFGLINQKKMKKEITPLLRQMGLDEKTLDSFMVDLTIGTQQLVLIIKGVYQKSKLLILDEPTSILSYEESQKLFGIIQHLSKKGVAILYISHRIPEILDISDRITILKDGELIQTLDNSKIDVEHILTLMSGRKIEFYQGTKKHHSKIDSDVIFSVENLSSPHAFENISFELKKGQILGLYGLIGAGRTELAQAIIGVRKYSGIIKFKQKRFHPQNIKEAYKEGIIYLPEDRITQGVFAIEKIGINMMSGLVKKLCQKFFQIDFRKEKKIINNTVDQYSIKVNNVNNAISTLSGGNQQKVLFSRCLLHNPEILILDEPTRGIDVKTKIDIYELINNLSNQGTTIILISSELSEIVSLTDSILVMHEGEYVDYFIGENCTEKNILRASLNSV